MIWLTILLSVSLVTVVYYLSYFAVSILLRVHNRHYFLGFGGTLLEFKMREVIFTLGIFIPVFGLARFRKIEGGMRDRADYPWQFFHRPWLFRVLATYAGAMGVLLFAAVVLVAVNLFVERQYVSRDEMNKYGILPSSLAERFGFQRGDRILTINGEPFESYEELLRPEVYETTGTSFLIERQGKQMVIHVPQVDNEIPAGEPFIDILVPFEIESVLAGSPAEAIGLQRGDRITAVNGTEIIKSEEMRRQFLADDDSTVDLRIERLIESDTLIKDYLAVRLDGRRNLGVFTREPIEYTVKVNTFREALRNGLSDTFLFLRYQFNATFRTGASPKKSVEGGISISAAFGDEHYWQQFWYLAANLASFCVIWNILPYPRSAFWETIPLIYERITSRRYRYPLFERSLQIAWFLFWAVLLLRLVIDLSKLF